MPPGRAGSWRNLKQNLSYRRPVLKTQSAKEGRKDTSAKEGRKDTSAKEGRKGMKGKEGAERRASRNPTATEMVKAERIRTVRDELATSSTAPIHHVKRRGARNMAASLRSDKEEPPSHRNAESHAGRLNKPDKASDALLGVSSEAGGGVSP